MSPRRHAELLRIHGQAGREEIAARRDRLGARIAHTGAARERVRLIDEDRVLADLEARAVRTGSMLPAMA